MVLIVWCTLDAADLISYGLIPEFVGRFPVIAPLEHLSDEELVRVIKEPQSALLKQYKKQFQMDGVEFILTDDAAMEIAKRANLRGTGARGLRSLLEEMLLECMFIGPDSRGCSVVLDREGAIQ